LATGSAPGFYVAIGYDSDVRPGNDEAVLDAFARVAALAVDRAVLTTELREERSVRASVLESLPIAISIFRGDPPIVVDWNAAERRMLGLGEDVRRPTDLAESQQQFNVRFADGTPVSIDNAPVTKAIRHGVKTGPILLRVTREDGVEIMTRTYCSPFRDDSGKVVGAVVTSDVVSGSVNLEA
jgi:PAS domain-containing protein